MPDVLFILVLALVIFGPAKLPQLARELGRYRAQFKQMQRALMEQVEAELNNTKASDSSRNGDTLPSL
jgi:Sec-independent protein translocase protein TatA